MNLLTTVYRLFIFMFIFYLPACQKATENVAPGPLPAGKLPDSIAVSLISTLPAELKESSGLCSTSNGIWSFGDSGNPNAIYKIDSITGAILQTVFISNYTNTDWEDITADEDYLYIGDVGNNLGFRNDLKILRIKKSDLTNNATQWSVRADAINYSYADQTDFNLNSNTNFNCEALIAAGDSLYLFSKDGSDLLTRCYPLPKQPGAYRTSPNATFNVGGKISAAAYNPATKELALLGYEDKAVAPFIWFFDGYKGYRFFSGLAKKFIIGNDAEHWQTEALEYVSAKRLMMTCEQSSDHAASLYYVQEY